MPVRRNQAKIDFLLKSPSGPVGLDLAKRALRVTNRAKAIITAVGAVDTGRLRAEQQHTDPTESPRGLTTQIGSNVEYSLPVHEGSESPYAPPSWQVAQSRGNPVRGRKFLTRALPAARG